MSPMSLTSPWSAGALSKVINEGLMQNQGGTTQLTLWANGTRSAMAIPATIARAANAAVPPPNWSTYVLHSKPSLGRLKAVTVMRKFLQRK